jgi:hypothetical protein
MIISDLNHLEVVEVEVTGAGQSVGDLSAYITNVLNQVSAATATQTSVNNAGSPNAATSSNVAALTSNLTFTFS